MCHFLRQDELHLLEFIDPVSSARGLEHQAAIGADALYAGFKLSLRITEPVVSFTAEKAVPVEFVYIGPLIGLEFHVAFETLYNITEQCVTVIITAGDVLE